MRKIFAFIKGFFRGLALMSSLTTALILTKIIRNAYKHGKRYQRLALFVYAIFGFVGRRLEDSYNRLDGMGFEEATFMAAIFKTFALCAIYQNWLTRNVLYVVM